MSHGRAGAIVALAAASIALAYLLPFRDYGLNFEDEGLILYSIARVADGHIPYVDFDTGYTPGYFYLNALLWRVAGALPTLRAFLALLHAASVAGLALLALRVASPVLALIVPLLYLAFIPVFPGGWCMFNIPYPAWYATGAWIVMTLALIRFVEVRRRGWLLAAGLAAAAALATKPNAGVFAIAAAVAVLLVIDEPTPARRRASAWVWWSLWAGVLVGPWVTLGLWPGARDAVAYLVPLTAALLALPTRVRSHRADLFGDAAVVLVSFVAPSLPWLVFFWSRLGTEGFLRDVLLIGSGAAQLYYVPYPAFEPWALVLTCAVAGIGVAGLGLRARWLRPWQVALVVALAGATGVAAVARIGVMPERMTWSLIWQLESAGFPLALATHAVGVVWLWRLRTTVGCEVPITLLLCALFMHLQLYPRADFAHLITAASLTIVFAGFLLERVLGWWRAGLAEVGGGRVARVALPVVVSVLVAVLALRVSPSLAGRLSQPGAPLPFAVAPVSVEREQSAYLDDLGTAATRLASLVAPGEPSLTFPAADIALFLTGAVNPSPVSYFFPGRPDHREEAEIVDVLARTMPAALISLNSDFFVFDDSSSYYFLLRRYVRARYALRERAGRFDVLVPAGGNEPPIDSTHVAEAVARIAAWSTQPIARAAPALLELGTGDDALVRRAAMTALIDRLASVPDEALETHVAGARLDRRREVLLLRTIRDTRDARAASYLFQAASRSDPRIVREALGAMFVVRAQLIARRNLWSGGDEPVAFPARGGLVTAVRTVLADAAAAPRASALAAHLAGVLGDADSVPLLRRRLAGDAATTASAADALARLAPAGLACDLVAMLARREQEMVVLMPTTVLGLADRGPARDETRACLERAIRSLGPPREPAIWIAAAMSDEAFAPALRDALLDDAPRVRRAAAWALGETISDAATSAALARAVAVDPDSVVRRLAGTAEAKQRGRAPRAFAAPADQRNAG